MSKSNKFSPHDIVKVIKTGEVRMVRGVNQTDNGYVYGVQLGKDVASMINMPEEELELVKDANADETGFGLFPSRKIIG